MHPSCALNRRPLATRFGPIGVVARIWRFRSCSGRQLHAGFAGVFRGASLVLAARSPRVATATDEARPVGAKACAL
eukprot:13762978-Alexandrium_andersonii.AAC.1